MAANKEDVLYLAVKQYVPWDNLHPSPGAVSTISTHANGVPRVVLFPSHSLTVLTEPQEAYEPFWVDLYQAARKSGLAIRGIWMADVAHQGVSGLVNEERLGNDRMFRPFLFPC